MGMIISVFFQLTLFVIAAIQFEIHFFSEEFEENYIIRNEGIWYLAGILTMIFLIISIALLLLDLNLIIFHFWLISHKMTTFDYMMGKWGKTD